MTKNRTIKPQTPGQEPIKEQMPPQVADEQAENDDEEITIKRGELRSLVADLVEERVVSEVKAARRKAELAKAPIEEDLPDQSEIDPAKIKGDVLTKQGWVSPLVSAADKAAMERHQGGLR